MSSRLRRGLTVSVALVLATSASAAPFAPSGDVGRGQLSRTQIGRSQERRRVTAFNRLARNLKLNGAVVAAPSGNAEYQFHWTRDAAITMAEVLVRIRELPAGAERDGLVGQYKKYIEFSHRMVKSESEKGAGEPKHELDGKVYGKWWARPQNDGPALRAMSAMSFAEWSLRHEGTVYVHGSLYDPRADHAQSQLIKSDLAYVYAHRNERSYDVWEEQRGFHYYTRAVQAQALAVGADFLHKMGDHETAAKYRAGANELKGYLDTHWDGRYGIIRSGIDPDLGAAYKWTGLDSAVILAANHVQGPHSPLKVLDERLLSTAHLLEVDFRNKYSINKKLKSGLFIGRYPEDRYTGIAGGDRDEGGNPWIITTHGFAEYYFRVAAELRRAISFKVTAVNRKFLLAALGEGEDSQVLRPEMVLHADNPLLSRLADAVVAKGDAFLKVVRDTVGDGVQTEQLHRETGTRMGAEELTWNYASFLSAMRARDRAGAKD